MRVEQNICLGIFSKVASEEVVVMNRYSWFGFGKPRTTPSRSSEKIKCIYVAGFSSCGSYSFGKYALGI